MADTPSVASTLETKALALGGGGRGSLVIDRGGGDGAFSNSSSAWDWKLEAGGCSFLLGEFSSLFGLGKGQRVSSGMATLGTTAPSAGICVFSVLIQGLLVEVTKTCTSRTS